MRTTVTFDDRHAEQIEEMKEELDDDEPGTSEAVRQIFDRAAEADELANQVDELRNRVDELRNQLQVANQRIDASNELVRYVEHERELQTRREWREERQAHAGLASRLKWSLVGMPDPPESVDGSADA